jgi:hypothetical protein
VAQQRRTARAATAAADSLSSAQTSTIISVGSGSSTQRNNHLPSAWKGCTTSTGHTQQPVSLLRKATCSRVLSPIISPDEYYQCWQWQQ